MGLTTRQCLGISFIGGMFLLFAFFWSLFAVGNGLKCIKASKMCYYQSHYLWFGHTIESFRFSDMMDASAAFLYEGRYHQKHFGLKIDVAHQPSIMLPRSSTYLLKKEIPKLKAYVANPQAEEFTLPPIIEGGPICMMLIPLVAGIAAVVSTYNMMIKANQAQESAK